MTRKPRKQAPKRVNGSRDGTERTKRTQAKHGQTESEDHYRSLISTMRAGFAYCRVVYDERDRPVDFVILTVNEAFGRLTGLTNVVGKAVSEVIPGIRELRPELFATFGRVASTGIPETFEFHFRSQGQRSNISAYSPKTGYFAALLDDITEPKRAIDELQRIKGVLAELQRIAHFGTWVVDLETDRLIWSDELYRIYGVSPDVFVPTPSAFAALIHPDDRSAVMAWINAIRSRATPGPVEFRIIRPDGTIRVIERRGELQTNAEDKPIRITGTAHDITDRKASDVGLRLFRALFDRSNDSLQVIDPTTGRFLDVNETACLELGYSREELLSLTVPDVDSTLDQSSFSESVERLRTSGGMLYEGYHRRKDGSTFPVQVSISLVRLDREYAVAVVRDITAWKASEQRLADAVRYNEAIMKASPIGIITYLASGEVVAANAAAAHLLGGTVEQVEKLNFRHLESRRRSGLLAAADAALERHEPHTEEVHSTSAFGKEIWVYCRLVPFEHEHQTYLLLVLSDVSERKHAERTLRLQAAALDAAADAIMITDRAGAIEWVNPAFTQLTGYTAEEALGKNPRELVKSDKHAPGIYKDLWDTILAGQTWHGQMINRRKDGSLYTDEQTVTPILDSAGAITHFVAIKEDVTERLHVQAQLLQAQKMESVGRLAGGVAHDFNNLLSVILGWTRMVLDDLPAASPVRPSLEEVLKAGQKAAMLTKQLLMLSRQEVVRPTRFSVNSVLGGLDKMFRRVLGEDIEIALKMDPELGTVQMDPAQLEQVLMNLAVNARDAMPAGGKLTLETANVVLDARYLRRDTDVAPGEYVVLTVSDSGIGMSEEVTAHMFEPFFTTKTAGKGTGLGLATSYGIIKQAGGQITVYSKEGLGTTMKVYLPRHHAAADAVVPARETPLLHGRETILVVEDELAVRQVTVQILTRQGYHVLTADSGEAALRVIEEAREPVHLLLTDIVLGSGVSGPGLADRVHATRPDLKVLFVSGYAGDVTTRHGLMQSGIPLVQKPFSADVLGRKVREVLDAG